MLEAVEELSDPKLRQPCRKVLESLQEHWTGLIRFVDDPRIPMDNNASERAGRGPAVARKNFYGSGSLWSGRLAAAMFSLLATLAHWKLNPRLWLTWYLESCAAAGGKAPEDIQPFLPWNLSAERRAALADANHDSRRRRHLLTLPITGLLFQPPSPHRSIATPRRSRPRSWANPCADGFDEALPAKRGKCIRQQELKFRENARQMCGK